MGGRPELSQQQRQRCGDVAGAAAYLQAPAGGGRGEGGREGLTSGCAGRRQAAARWLRAAGQWAVLTGAGGAAARLPRAGRGHPPTQSCPAGLAGHGWRFSTHPGGGTSPRRKHAVAWQCSPHTRLCNADPAHLGRLVHVLVEARLLDAGNHHWVASPLQLQRLRRGEGWRKRDGLALAAGAMYGEMSGTVARSIRRQRPVEVARGLKKPGCRLLRRRLFVEDVAN